MASTDTGGLLVTDDIRLGRYLHELLTAGDVLTARQIADQMNDSGYHTYEYYTGLYHLLSLESADLEQRIEALEQLMDISMEEDYALELAKLYRMAGRDKESDRLCKKVIRFFLEGPGVDQAQQILSGETVPLMGGLPQKAPAPPPMPAEPKEPQGPRAKPPEVKKPKEEMPVPPPPVEEPPVVTDEPTDDDGIPIEISQHFEGLIGLQSIKNQLLEFYHVEQLRAQREKAGLYESGKQGYNFVLLGNPGTGKTTVARIIGKVLVSLGVLQKEDLVECDRTSIVAAHIGGTEENMLGLIDQARGGTLFIDEAYNLYKKESGNDFGKEAIDVLLKDMEDNRGSYSVILAGYKEPMQEMLKNANPGFRSRFAYIIEIPDYTTDELLQIADSLSSADNYVLSADAREEIKKRVDRERVDKTFGNARYIRELIYEGQRRLATRLAGRTDLEPQDMILLKKEDFEYKSKFGPKKTTKEILDELDELTGLDEVKHEVRSLTASLQAKKEAEKRGIKTASKQGTLHMSFLGNPGTGKTTVARIIARLYASLGILKREDVFVEVTRADLVGKYMGHTAEKVKEVVASAMGGVLFIDEAYALCTGENDSFGLEAVNTLIAEMENNRDSLVVVLAGYTNEMDEFMNSNPGLRSRVNTAIHFADYSTDDMLAIFEGLVTQNGCQLEDGIDVHLRAAIDRESQKKDFGNARGVRNLFERVLRNRDMRIADKLGAGDELTDVEFVTITMDDLKV